MSTIIISREKIKKEGGVVILPLKEYQELCERAVPIYYLKGRAAKRLDKLVGDGLREHKAGKTINAPSLKNALNIYVKGREH